MSKDTFRKDALEEMRRERSPKVEQEIERWVSINGKRVPIFKKFPTVYRGGKDADIDDNDIIFTTTSKNQAHSYGALKGTLHSIEIDRNAKAVTLDMQGSNYRQAYKYLNEQVLDLSKNEIVALNSGKGDPLLAIAKMYKARGYQVFRVKDVNDFHGVIPKGVKINPAEIMDEYIILDKSIIRSHIKNKL